jgi:DNA-binding FadR family transcriptional regulator
LPIQSIEPQRLYRRIADQLRALMAAHELAPGTRLPPERDLARQFGVSRPSVREALIALEVEGLVDVRIGSGVFVRETPAAEATRADGSGPFEVLAARRLIESECAALAAKRIEDGELDVLGRALATMRDEVAAGAEPIEADRRFHTAIAAAAGNSALAHVVDVLWRERTAPLYRRLDRHFFDTRLWAATLKEHEAILAALRAGRAAAARRAMTHHLDNAARRFSKGWSGRAAG